MKQKFKRCLLIAAVAWITGVIGTGAAAAAEQCRFSLPIRVSWTQKDLPEKTAATFVLTADRADTPMPEQTKLTVAADQASVKDGKLVAEAAFSEITYSRPEDHTYVLKQEPSDDRDMKTDDTVYKITVRVYYDESGKLTAVIAAVNGKTGAKPQDLAFENSYTKPEIQEPPAPSRHVPPT